MMGPQLELVEGHGAGRRLWLQGALMLGRAVTGDGRLGDDPEVSRRHALVLRGDDGGLVVVDLGSDNGTWVNGRRIEGRHRLHPGDRLRVGRTTFEVIQPAPADDEEAGRAADARRERPAAQRGVWLEVVAGPGAGRRVELDSELVLGRAVEGDGGLPEDPDASRRHARIRRGAGGDVVVEDLGSSNGTWVNGTRIDAPRSLSTGDRVRLGQTTLLFTVAEAPEPDAHPTQLGADAHPTQLGADAQPTRLGPAAQPTRAVSAASPREPPEPLERSGPPSRPQPPTVVDQTVVARARGDQLEVIAGEHVGRRVVPDGELVLGRGLSGDGGLGDDRQASRRHARVWHGEDAELIVEDLGSTNGTWVNGERIEATRALLPGDTVRVGQTLLVVRDALGRIPAATRASAAVEGQPAGAPATDEQLEVVEGADVGRRLRIEDRLLLGRAVQGDGRLDDDPEVSRRHARVTRDADRRLVVEDLGSGNGTWVNGERIEAPRPLAAGDRVKVGQTVFALTDGLGRIAAPSAQRRIPRGADRRGAFSALAGAIMAHRRAVLVLVAVFVIVAAVVGGRVATVLSQGNDFNDPEAPSVLAEQRLADAAGAEPAARVIAVVRAEEGRIASPGLDARARRQGARAQRLADRARAARDRARTPAGAAEASRLAEQASSARESARATRRRAERARSDAAQERVERVEQILDADPSVARALTYYETGSPAFVSDDRRSTYVAAFLEPDANQDEVSERLTDRLGDEAQVTLGGAALAGPAVGRQAEIDLRAAETIALPLLFVLSLFVFRGVVAALLPVFVGVITVLGTFLGLRLVNEVQLQSIFALNMVVGLGLGLAIDYSLFILSRYREELARSGPGLEPLRRTLETAGRTVLFSAVTVGAALASLLVFPQRFLYSMGTGGLICTLMAAAAALLALTALLAVLGPRVNSLAPKAWQVASQRDARGERSGFWYRLSQAVMRRPLPIATACTALLVAAGLPFLDIRFAGVDASVLPRSDEVRQVHEALEHDFSENPASPISIAVTAPRDAGSRLEDYADELEKLPGVAGVGAPDRLDERTWRITVTPEHGPFDERTLDVVERIREGDAPFPVQPAGEAAAFVDQQASLADRLPLALGILVASTVVLLFLMTGSVVLPLKSVLMNFLGLSATFGLLVLIFQDGRLEGLLNYESEGALNATQPILLFIVAFGLSTDYGVFLLTRIKEVRDAGASNQEAVAIGLERTGRIVTAAAVLFSVALGAFATSKIVFIKLVGVGAVLAVLIDSSIVRALLVPSLMALLGARNWWAPRPLRKLHERFGLGES